MRKFGLLANVVLLAVVLLTSGVGTAAAEPQKNQILVPVRCDNGQSYTLVINGMSKVGQIIGDNNNIVVTEFTVTYRNLKNQILVPVRCDNGQSYTLVINGMSKVGQIIGDNNNIVVTEFTVTYRNL